MIDHNVLTSYVPAELLSSEPRRCPNGEPWHHPSCIMQIWYIYTCINLLFIHSQMAFFGGKDIGSAFKAASKVDDIATWFRAFATYPDRYKIRNIERPSMNNAATIIEWVRDNFNNPDFMATKPFFPDAYAVGQIQYQGNDVTIATVFDVVGWVLSVVGYGIPDDPNNPKNLETNKENYFYPLLALFAVMCRTLVGSRGKEPTMVQVTWFMKGGVWLVALGANLDAPTSVLKPRKEDAQVCRARTMFDRVVIDAHTFFDINFPMFRLQLSIFQGIKGQVLGHCAETLPYMFVQSFMPSFTSVNKSTIGGLAVVPKLLLGSATTYDMIKNNFKPVQSDSKSAMQDPCSNCIKVIKFLYGEAALSRFMVPIVSK
ncbi:hypothetical protein AX15_004531 [Amanita polypyramis BW_CC]|nr:hypothetical protein AX15_004531 [Amanita polypyramis BW_CC]